MLKEISTTDLVAVSGGVDVDQFLTQFLATVTPDELKSFVRNNVHVDVNVQVMYYPQLDTCYDCDIMM